jgi:Ca-activated chloride channel family protein
MDRAGLFGKDDVAIPLEGVEIGGEVLGSHARIVVIQRYRNREAKAIEAVYTFPLSPEGALIGFRLRCDGREVAGVVKEREEAFHSYDEAIASGHGAALLEQERPNVFTASVGNLLPDEETVIEIEYLERLQADEGALRLVLPTLVAPRYIPGQAAGDRTAHGQIEPTDRVPDADRITPPISRSVPYDLTVDLTFDVGRELELESPSHAISVEKIDGKPHVKLSGERLDRDLVVIARGLDTSTFTTVALHKSGHFALTVVPDLGGLGRKALPQEVVFLIDISGSMGGSSLQEAQSALRLCLRHLREGDRFNIIAFDDQIERFEKAPVPFTQKTLEAADEWVAALEARGGTEILAPLLEAASEAPNGVIVLLTDGQVGNENEILEQVLAKRQRSRIYSFGIGTNVSDWMLRELGRRSGGAVELIHPGERIDEKVVAQFARAVAARVDELKVEFTGLDVGEQSYTSVLVDGEPWALFGHIDSGQSGSCRVRGLLDGKPFELEVPLDVREAVDRPAVAKLWAKERIRDLEAAQLSGRRQEAMKSRIVKLAVEHQLVCSHTSFVVVETRTGERRQNAQPETRVIPVNVPAGWDLFAHKPKPRAQFFAGGVAGSAMGAVAGNAMGAAAPPPSAMSPAAAYGSPPSAPKSIAAPVMAAGKGLLSKVANLLSPAKKEAKKAATQSFRRRPEPADIADIADIADGADGTNIADKDEVADKDAGDALRALLGAKLASGLWDENDPTADENLRRARATARRLLELASLGITAAHPLHGAQIKKAVEALLALVPQLPNTKDDAKVAELALGAAWLVSSGRRTRHTIEAEMTRLAVSLRGRLADEKALHAHLVQLGA